MSDRPEPGPGQAGLGSPADAEAADWMARCVARAYLPPDSLETPWLELVHSRQHLYSATEEWRAQWSGGERRLFLKRYDNRFLRGADAERHLRDEYEALTELWPLFQPLEGLAVPRPLGQRPGHGQLLMEKAPGEGLDHLVRRYPLRRVSLVRGAVWRMGAWLATLHRATAGIAPAQVGLARLLEELERDAPLCEQAGVPAGLVRRAAELVRRAAPSLLASAPAVGCHGDLGPGNVLATEDGISVIDFTFYRPGSALHDLEFFLASLEYLLGPRFTPDLRQRLLDGYRRGYPLDLEALRCVRVAKMLTLVGWSPALQRGGNLRTRLRRVLKLAFVSGWLYRTLPRD